MIKAENIVKSYNENMQVLKGVSLAVERGEFVVISGASGSGKTTLMNILSGLETADGGSVTVCGNELNNMNDRQLTEFRKKYVGFVFQQYYLLPHLSVDSNIKAGADLARNGDYSQIVTALGLGDKLKSKPGQLSGGEQQRVCIARALAKKPQILFCDEPTGALDEETGREVLNCIAEQKRESGFTVVMVTHNANIAEMADTVIKMKSGRIVESYKNTAVKSAYQIGW